MENINKIPVDFDFNTFYNDMQNLNFEVALHAREAEISASKAFINY